MIFISNPWGSGEIRGRQIAKALGAKCDPEEKVSSNNVFIIVKAWPVDLDKVVERFKRVYIDVVDGVGLITLLAKFPTVRAIAISNMAKQYLSRRIENDIVTIPEHHCNFENVTRPDREVKTVGFIGYPGNFDLDIDEVGARLGKIGMDFVWKMDFQTRYDVCEFYKNMDIQLTFRKWSNDLREPPELKNPLKLENAGSFRIPSVCYPEPNYVDEFGADKFISVRNLDEVVQGCTDLRMDADLYESVAKSAWQESQQYHINNIVPLYRKLEE